ncbi:hypothetical protein LOC08_09425, partial [Lactobacillus delbrueckii subsp. lactis]|uniref:hypothetical protein n=1 Tax=Lactobacillus delbrueckii TaxID=1584 RepID=UPI001E283CA7
FDIDDVVVELYQANKGLVLFLLAKLLNFQGTSPRLQVGSLSNKKLSLQQYHSQSIVYTA